MAAPPARSRPPRRDARLRLFIAAYPPPDAARSLAAIAADPGFDPIRRLPPADIHLTLQFLGDTPVRSLDDTIESVERSASGIGPFVLTPLRAILLPPRGRARVLAVETDAPPPVLELHRRLAHRFARSARPDASDRYLPHLTVARFPGPGRTPRPPVPTDALEIEPFRVDAVHLVKSVLRPGGAVHDIVASIALR